MGPKDEEGVNVQLEYYGSDALESPIRVAVRGGNPITPERMNVAVDKTRRCELEYRFREPETFHPIVHHRTDFSSPVS